MLNKPKPKKCKICAELFTPFLTTAKVCSITCSITYAERTREDAQAKINRKAYKDTKEKLKTLTELANEAQVVFNQWIRNCRDKNEPCISCGTTNKLIQYCAGHFITVGASSHLRFNEDNVHRQCNHHCNLMKSGNIILYREALIKKIGQERYDAVVNNRQIKSWTREELKELKIKYKMRIKQND